MSLPLIVAEAERLVREKETLKAKIAEQDATIEQLREANRKGCMELEALKVASRLQSAKRQEQTQIIQELQNKLYNLEHELRNKRDDEINLKDTTIQRLIEAGKEKDIEIIRLQEVFAAREQKIADIEKGFGHGDQKQQVTTLLGKISRLEKEVQTADHRRERLAAIIHQGADVAGLTSETQLKRNAAPQTPVDAKWDALFKAINDNMSNSVSKDKTTPAEKTVGTLWKPTTGLSKDEKIGKDNNTQQKTTQGGGTDGPHQQNPANGNLVEAAPVPSNSTIPHDKNAFSNDLSKNTNESATSKEDGKTSGLDSSKPKTINMTNVYIKEESLPDDTNSGSKQPLPQGQSKPKLWTTTGGHESTWGDFDLAHARALRRSRRGRKK